MKTHNQVAILTEDGRIEAILDAEEAASTYPTVEPRQMDTLPKGAAVGWKVSRDGVWRDADGNLVEKHTEETEEEDLSHAGIKRTIRAGRGKKSEESASAA